MRLIDSVIENSFKKTDEGRDIFYPFGVLGKGRIIPNDNEKKKLLGFLNYYCSVGFGLIFIAPIMKLYTIIVALCAYIFYCLQIKHITKTYEISEVKLLSKEVARKISKNSGKGFIIFYLIFGIFLSILGVFLFVYFGLDSLAPLGLSAIGLFIFIGYLRILILSKK